MNFNMIDDSYKLRITFPFMEAVKTPQQREKLLRVLDESYKRMEVAVISSKEQQNLSLVKPRGKAPLFYITIKNHDIVLHNCSVDSGDTMKLDKEFMDLTQENSQLLEILMIFVHG